MYDVGWVESAVLKLAEAWTRANSADRAAITAASHRIEEALRLTRWTQVNRALMSDVFLLIYRWSSFMRSTTTKES